MPRKIVLVSGSVASGKSTLVERLRRHFDVHVVKTKHVIRQIAAKKLDRELEAERRAMQKFGDRLDRETKGQWVRDALRRTLSQLGPNERDAVAVVDAVRIPLQIARIRESYGHVVVHIHLRAPEGVLEARYKERDSGLKELASLSALSEGNKTEARINNLERIADIVIDTERSSRDDVLVRAAAALGLHSREYDRRVDVVVGGQFGSEGKGHIASYMAGEYQVLVRVGGPNAGHKVFMSPSPYTHHQLPSGTLRNPLAQLVIAPGAVLNPDSLMREVAECKVDSERLFIDPQAMIVTEADIRNEKGLQERIGSTRQGVGFATARRITERGKRGVRLARDIKVLAPYIRPTWDVLEKAYGRGDRILLEGTQGTGLSLYHGPYPFVTSRDTTIAGCLSEAGIAPGRVRKVVMVCRTYPIRVQDPTNGTSGTLSQEISWEVVAERSKVPIEQLVKAEKTSTTNRDRRVSEFDWVQLRKAAALNGPSDIALTFADYLDQRNEAARRYEQLQPETIRFIEEVERVAAAPVSLISTRFDFRSVIDRRNWGKL
jgi:adenylosuccinate synthase